MSKRTAPLLRARRPWLIVGMLIGVIVGSGAFFLGPGLRSPTAGLLGRGWDVYRAEVDVTVRPDASLTVREDLHVRVKEKAWDDVYLPVSPGEADVDLVTLENVSGESLDSENESTPIEVAPDVQESTEDRPGGSFRVRGLQGIQGSAEERQVRLELEVRKAVEVYDDVVFVRWVVRSGDANAPLDRLDATIRIEAEGGATVTPLRSWVRPGALGAHTVDGDEAATLRVTSLRRHEEVVMSAMFPRDDRLSSTGGAVVHDGDGRAAIEAREDRLVAAGGSGGIATFVWSHRLVLAGLVLLLALAATTALVGVGHRIRRRHGVARPDAAGHVPESVSPATAFGFAALRADESTIVLATLLDLVDRGFYTGRVGPDGDLAIARATPRPPEATLTPGEARVLGFFDRRLGGQTRGLAELHLQVPRHEASVRHAWEQMVEALEETATQELPFERDLRPWRVRIIVAGTVLLGLLAVLGLGRSTDVRVFTASFPLLVGIVVAYPSHLLRPLTEKGYDRHRDWKAFGTWTYRVRRGDAPLDRGGVGWPRTLAYAVAFGTLEQVIAAGQLPAAGEAPAGAWWADLAGRLPTFLEQTGVGTEYGERWRAHLAPESSD